MCISERITRDIFNHELKLRNLTPGQYFSWLMLKYNSDIKDKAYLTDFDRKGFLTVDKELCFKQYLELHDQRIVISENSENLKRTTMKLLAIAF